MITRSKAYWGYNVALLEAWHSGLPLSPETIVRDPVYCAEVVESGCIRGVSHFYWLNDEDVYLDHLFVEPTSIGQGIGSALWRHAIQQASAAGVRAVVLDADPHACTCYERRGAVAVGWKASSVVPGWRTPYLRYDLLPRPSTRTTAHPAY